MVPYTLALALLFGLFALELAFALLGGTLLGAGGGEADLDGPDFAAEPFDLDIDLEPGVDLESGLTFDFAGMEADLADYDLPAFEGDPVAEVADAALNGARPAADPDPDTGTDPEQAVQ